LAKLVPPLAKEQLSLDAASEEKFTSKLWRDWIFDSLKLKHLIQGETNWLQRTRRKLATGCVVALLCLIGYHAVFGANGFLAFHQKTGESRRLQQEIEALQRDNARRELQVKALKSEPQAIEREARERLRYARPGEMVYTLPTASPTPVDPK
jgi:cell division protein FtsB